jgi:hypothetical protein
MKVRAPFDAEQLRIRVNRLLAWTAPERELNKNPKK